MQSVIAYMVCTTKLIHDPDSRTSSTKLNSLSQSVYELTMTTIFRGGLVKIGVSWTIKVDDADVD